MPLLVDDFADCSKNLGVATKKGLDGARMARVSDWLLPPLNPVGTTVGGLP